jgi:drug/metabolite transporter (DMT)-like permease
LWLGSLYGLSGAVLFGASTPFSKRLLPGVPPLMLAALLYLGAGTGISVFRLTSFIRWRESAEAALRRSDIGLLGAVIVFGGIAGPVLMLVGLTRISALAASLLLNLEAVFTILIAVTLLGEHLTSQSGLASIFVILGAVVLSYQPGAVRGDFLGMLAIVGACLSWAIDNNLSQRLSLRDPVAVVQVKTVGAGATTLGLALLTGHRLPTPAFLSGALALGSLSYGVSLVCVMQALRYIGAAREAAWFSTAPFIGAILSIPILGALPSAPEVAGAIFMIAGAVLLLREQHRHLHTHEGLEHDHVHSHDQHHQHPHEDTPAEPHSHPHRHQITHEHTHLSDLHHRHRHA